MRTVFVLNIAIAGFLAPMLLAAQSGQIANYFGNNETQMCGGCGCYPSQGPLGPRGPQGEQGPQGEPGSSSVLNYGNFYDDGSYSIDLGDPVFFSVASPLSGMSLDGTGTEVTIDASGIYYVNYTVVHNVTGSPAVFKVTINGTGQTQTRSGDDLSSLTTSDVTSASKGALLFITAGDVVSLVYDGVPTITLGGFAGNGASLTIFRIADLPSF